MMMDREKKWIRMVQRRSDEQAANALVELYYRKVYGYVYRQTSQKELAMDLTQEIFVSMLQSIHLFEGKRSSFQTWLFRIATNKVIDYYRSRQYRYDRLSDPMEEHEVHHYDEDFTLSLVQKEDVEMVLHAVNELDHYPQQIIRLKLFGDYTFAEIGTTLNVPESSVKTKYYATIRKIKLSLEGTG